MQFRCQGTWVGKASMRLAWPGVARAVVGLRHPLAHLRGVGEVAMLRAGIAVEVLGEAPAAAPPEQCADALSACLRVNEVRVLPGRATDCACREAGSFGWSVECGRNIYGSHT